MRIIFKLQAFSRESGQIQPWPGDMENRRKEGKNTRRWDKAGFRRFEAYRAGAVWSMRAWYSGNPGKLTRSAELCYFGR
jgi:hypothetical protein